LGGEAAGAIRRLLVGRGSTAVDLAGGRRIGLTSQLQGHPLPAARLRNPRCPIERHARAACVGPPTSRSNAREAEPGRGMGVRERGQEAPGPAHPRYGAAAGRAYSSFDPSVSSSFLHRNDLVGEENPTACHRARREKKPGPEETGLKTRTSQGPRSQSVRLRRQPVARPICALRGPWKRGARGPMGAWANGGGHGPTETSRRAGNVLLRLLRALRGEARSPQYPSDPRPMVGRFPGGRFTFPELKPHSWILGTAG